ncbi:MAG: DUF445 family protein [Sphingobacteriia bacterium]|nr:MAG: DUF445 family protein [Sphingobacteriia bacterium]
MNLIYLIPFISAFIGWFTNWVAIKMLFHPREPKKILGLTIQGIFPKRQQVFAAKLGQMVTRELISFEEIEARILAPNHLQRILPVVDNHIDQFLKVKLAETMPVISMFIGDKTTDQLKKVFMGELEMLFPQLLSQYMAGLKTELDLEKMVTQKVSAFSSDKLEQILQDIMSKEFRFIEVLGGILGFIIGLFQVLLTLLA